MLLFYTFHHPKELIFNNDFLFLLRKPPARQSISPPAPLMLDSSALEQLSYDYE
jgi:hypothetical protein